MKLLNRLTGEKPNIKTDEEITRIILTRDKDFFRKLAQRYQKKLYFYLYSLTKNKETVGTLARRVKKN